MAIKLEEYEEICKQMPKGGKGDEIEDLTDEEEEILDKVWKELAEKERN